MNLNLDLNAIPRREAALILRALAGVYDSEAETVTTTTATGDMDGEYQKVEKPKEESLGNTLMKNTEKRNAEAETQTAPANNAPDLSAGPPSNQPIDELDQAAGITEAVQTTPSVAAGPLDAKGMPHDERIHAKTQTKMGSGPRNGCWKYKPKVSDEVKAQVEAELLAQLPQAGQAPAAADQTIATPLNTAGPTAGPAPGPQDTAQTTQTPQIGEVVQHTFNAAGDFAPLLKMVTDDVGAKKMPQGVTSSITGDLGCENIMVLGQHPDKYQAFADTWCALRSMIELQPALADQSLSDWAGVRAMVQIAVA